MRLPLKPTDVIPDEFDPTENRPVTLIARDAEIAEFVRPHTHPWGQLTHALDGILRVTTGDSSWIVPPSRAIWIAPGIEHSITLLKPARLRPLRILACRSPFSGESCRVIEVSSLLRELTLALEQLPQLDVSLRRKLLSELILEELARSETRPIRVPLPQEKRLKALCSCLMNDPSAPHTLVDWARQVGACERTLARLFERELGMTFSQWRQQVRLAHAAAMIARGERLSRVAEELGYASQSAFSQMFKKAFGCTPSVFFAGR
ncbi:MAG TPA: helix-turn-helix transcriptional regulator [Noviherbaspirillum sp.]